MLFDLELHSSELGEVAFVRSLTTRREDLLKRLSEAPPELEALLLLRAEAAVLRQMYRDIRLLVEDARKLREDRSVTGHRR